MPGPADAVYAHFDRLARRSPREDRAPRKLLIIPILPGRAHDRVLAGAEPFRRPDGAPSPERAPDFIRERLGLVDAPERMEAPADGEAGGEGNAS